MPINLFCRYSSIYKSHINLSLAQKKSRLLLPAEGGMHRRLWEPTQHDKDDESYIFTNTDGGPIDLSYVNKILRQIHYDKHLSTHIFRHTHISILAEAGVSLKAIMQRVGHNEPATTLSVYTHVTDAMENEAVEAIEKIT